MAKVSAGARARTRTHTACIMREGERDCSNGVVGTITVILIEIMQSVITVGRTLRHDERERPTGGGPDGWTRVGWLRGAVQWGMEEGVTSAAPPSPRSLARESITKGVRRSGCERTNGQASGSPSTNTHLRLLHAWEVGILDLRPSFARPHQRPRPSSPHHNQLADYAGSLASRQAGRQGARGTQS